VIQLHLGGGPRRPKGEKSEERSVGVVVVAVSHSRGLFGGDWRTMGRMFCFCETSISFQ
jgi:hypothetical protein